MQRTPGRGNAGSTIRTNVMAWIESHQTLREHPKVHHLSELLKASKAATLGHLHLLWWWCVDYCPGGELKANDVLIARAGEWPGDAKEFVSALVESGWLDRGDGVLSVHDWQEYSGRLIDLREANRQRQQRFRERKRDETVTSRVTNAATQPYQTKPNQTGEGSARAREGPRLASPAHKAGPAGAVAPPPTVSAALATPGKAEPEPLTNKPTLAQALKRFEASDYTPAEVRQAYDSFEASKDRDGAWWWGKRLVGDWRAAIETRMADNRQAHGKPIRNTGDVLRNMANKALSEPIPEGL